MAQSEICYDPRVSGERRFQWTVALILFGVLFLGVSDTQLVAPLLPLIASDLGITPGHAGIIVTTYSLAAAAFALFVGPVSDRVGRKKVLVSGLAVFSLASFFTYHVSTFGALVILRALTGLAAGTLSTSALSFAGDYYPYEERGRAMGILSMGYFVAFVAGVRLSAHRCFRSRRTKPDAGRRLAGRLRRRVPRATDARPRKRPRRGTYSRLQYGLSAGSAAGHRRLRRPISHSR